MYGIGVDKNGQAYEMGADGDKKIPSQASIVAKKQIAAQKAAQAKAAQIAAQQNKQRIVRGEEEAKKKAILRKKQEESYSTFQGLFGAHNEMAFSGHMKNLGGMIGNSLNGFETKGEYDNAVGADFGSLGIENEANFGGFFDTITSFASSGAKLAGDELESLIKKVIERRALIQEGDKAFYARMKKLPASAQKTADIKKYTDMALARDNGATMKLYWNFANVVVTALESISKERAARLKMLFDNPSLVLQEKGSIDKALSGDDGLGIAPLIMGLGVAATASTAAAGYIAGSGNDAKIAQEEIEKNRKLLLDPNVPAAVKVELAKTIASGTEKLSQAALESAKQGGIIGNIGGAVSKVTTLVGVAAGAFILVKYVLPMLQQRQAKA